ncbi:hypothetical protein NQ315_007309 [Exocentrus adspersus]|uniref:Uncharacterized protein n=1 Tax=Exocentrus adspersus TaxID=1586481 RepID=A0AAV8WDJ7_9CUCU|nr:hypothetical protein NQ315_007309 [Exocentrus adspersus]
MVLQLQYDLQVPYISRRRVIDYEHVPYTKYPTTALPNYSIYRPVDRYDKWPKWYQAYHHIPEVRFYLNNLLMRDFDVPRHKYVHTYW